jgi:hypothetical protein
MTEAVPSPLEGLARVAAAIFTVLGRAITVLALTILAGVLLMGVGVDEIALAVRLRS